VVLVADDWSKKKNAETLKLSAFQLFSFTAFLEKVSSLRVVGIKKG